MSSFAWEDLDDVHHCLKNETTKCNSNKKEAFFRTCLNRCYYVALNVAKRTAIQKFSKDYYNHQNSCTGGTHEVVIQFFRNRTDAESKIIADTLYRMKKYRVASDYHESIVVFNPEKQVPIQEQELQVVLQNLAKL